MAAFLIPLLFFVLVWVLFILPQQRRVREHQLLVARLAVGQEVMTTAGMFGVISAIDGDEVLLEVAPGIALRFARGAISRVVTPSGEDAPAGGDDDGALTDEGEPDAGDAASPGPGPVIQPRRGVLRRAPRESDR